MCLNYPCDRSENSRYPLVSVVTPSYNAMPFIRETIESVLMQDYPRVEHIVIDGGSSDGTRELLQQYPHLVWLSEPDRGQSHALNKGFRRAKGEVIGWLNADDTYKPGAIRRAVAHFQDHPEADAVYSDCQIVDEFGKLLRISKSQAFDLEKFLMNNFIKQPTVFMRKQVLESIGGVDEDLHFVMDRELWLRVGLLFDMHYIQGQTFANFRLCKGTKSFEHSPQFHLEWMDVLEHASQYMLLDRIKSTVINAALRKTRGGYCLAKMRVAQQAHNRWEMIRYLFLAFFYDWSLIFNPGSLYLVTEAILGKRLAETLRKLSGAW